MFVELRLYRPLDRRTEEARSALHQQARRLKSGHGLRQVSVLQERDGNLGLLTIWESRDAWTSAQTAREDAERETDLTSIDPGNTRLLLFEET